MLVLVNSMLCGPELRPEDGMEEWKLSISEHAVWELNFAYILHTHQPSEDATLTHLWIESKTTNTERIIPTSV